MTSNALGSHEISDRIDESGRAASPNLRSLIRGTAATVGLNITTVCVNFALALVLARELGAKGYGAYAYAFAWATFLSVPASLGLSPLVIRHVASYTASHEWGRVRGVIWRANQAVVAASIVLVLGALVAGLVLSGSGSTLFAPFLIGLLLVPLIALTSLRQAAMQGLNRVVLGRTPDTLVVPALFLTMVVVAAALRGSRFTAVWAIALNVAAASCGLVIGALLLRSVMPSEARHARPEYETRSWARSGLPLLALSLVLVVNTQVGTILLGSFDGADSAGVFNVSMRVATFTSFLWTAASYPLYPTVAKLWIAGDNKALQSVLTRSARATLAVSLLVGVVLIAFARPILGLFGGDFQGGATVLRVLVLGELARVAMGFGGLALVMTPYESTLTRGMTFGVVLNIPLTAALIPVWGVTGAAVGATLSTVLSSAYVARLTWDRLRLYVPAVTITLRRSEHRRVEP